VAPRTPLRRTPTGLGILSRIGPGPGVRQVGDYIPITQVIHRRNEPDGHTGYDYVVFHNADRLSVRHPGFGFPEAGKRQETKTDDFLGES
jgi:hypothetical protein